VLEETGQVQPYAKERKEKVFFLLFLFSIFKALFKRKFKSVLNLRQNYSVIKTQMTSTNA